MVLLSDKNGCFGLMLGLLLFCAFSDAKDQDMMCEAFVNRESVFFIFGTDDISFTRTCFKTFKLVIRDFHMKGEGRQICRSKKHTPWFRG